MPNDQRKENDVENQNTAPKPRRPAMALRSYSRPLYPTRGGPEKANGALYGPSPILFCPETKITVARQQATHEAS